MAERIQLSKKTRFEVFKRDGFTCIYCGGRPPNVILHCDHVVAVARGGTNEIDNLVTACDACNLGKGARDLTTVPLTIEQKTAVMRERQEQVAAFNAAIAEKIELREESAWIIADEFTKGWASQTGSFSRARFASIERFVELLTLDEILEAVDLAQRKFPWSKGKCFQYFCGICWRKIERSKNG